MKTITVKLKDRPYNIIVGSHIIGRLGSYLSGLKIGQDAYVITNAAIKKRYGIVLTSALKKAGFSVKTRTVLDTEQSKSIETASFIIRELSVYDKKRRIFIVAFGGGVIGDLSGFVASIYKRGIPYIQIPTSFLAQIDSSIGGKTGVDLREGKNLVGAFYQPRLVFSDVSFLATLSQRQVRAGLAEALKYGIIKDKPLFAYLEKNLKDILALKPRALEYVVDRCSRIKADIVAKDEREEKGLRTILNFGHTIGHAIEAAAGFRAYNHGECVALGMLVATELSQRLNLLDKDTGQRIEDLIKAAGLPAKIKHVSLAGILKAHFHDKKFSGKKNKFVLIRDIGKTKIVFNLPIGFIKKALLKIQA